MNNQNEQFEFLTRRTFFKKVSKKILPIIGSIVIANIPNIAVSNSKTPNDCISSCKIACANNCYTGCEGKCSDHCAHSCSENCSGHCTGTCKSTCDSTCKNTSSKG